MHFYFECKLENLTFIMVLRKFINCPSKIDKYQLIARTIDKDVQNFKSREVGRLY